MPGSGNFRSDLEPRQQVMPAVPAKRAVGMPPAPVKPMPAPTAQVMPQAAPTAGGPMPPQNDQQAMKAQAAQQAMQAQAAQQAMQAPVKPMGMKKGGCVKKMAKGGSVSSASKRADGIATKGKTRGKII